MPTLRSEFLAGVRAELPLLLGVIPFGMIYGVLALAAGLPPGLSQAMSSVVFAGSAQFVTTQLIATGTPFLPVVLTAMVVNLRHALYSASIAPYIQHLPRRWKWILAYLLTDEAYAVTVTHYQETTPDAPTPVGYPAEPALGRRPTTADGRPISTGEPADDPCLLNTDFRHWFFLGSGLALWSSWQLSTAIGIFLGARIPENWSLDFTLALTFIALVVPALKDRAGVTAALVGGMTAVLAADLPMRLGLVFAALVGILAGLGLDVVGKRNQKGGREKREAT